MIDSGGYAVMDLERRGAIKLVRSLSALVLALAVISAGAAGSAWLLLGAPVAVAVFFVAPRLPRRPTPEGLETYRACRRLRNFVRARDGMDWKPPAAVVVWERYLVLAVVFGLAGTVLKALSVNAPAAAADPATRRGCG